MAREYRARFTSTILNDSNQAISLINGEEAVDKT